MNTVGTFTIFAVSAAICSECGCSFQPPQEEIKTKCPNKECEEILYEAVPIFELSQTELVSCPECGSEFRVRRKIKTTPCKCGAELKKEK